MRGTGRDVGEDPVRAANPVADRGPVRREGAKANGDRVPREAKHETGGATDELSAGVHSSWNVASG